MRIFLVGFMGSGKTTTGQALARRLGALFWDLDGRVEASLRMCVAEIFRGQGEPAFRREETRQLAAAQRFDKLVVATGGGTYCQTGNRELIARLGIAIFVDVGWGEIVRRLPGKQEERPLFGSPDQALRLYRERLPHYRQADITVRPDPGEDVEALAGRISMLLPRSP